MSDLEAGGPTLVDSFGRAIHDLRISITDRCNFRCLYCLPETEEAADFFLRSSKAKPLPIHHKWKPKSHFLSYEEIVRVARVAAGLGVNKIRLTGGEPLLRRDVPRLVEQLAVIPGIKDIAITTNGFSFVENAEALQSAGLSRVTFSLDSLDQDNFKRLTGREGLRDVMRAIARAKELGFSPIRINAVVIRGLNDHEILPLARFALDQELAIRFIEFMPLDSGRAWQKDHVVTGREILRCLQTEFDLEPMDQEHPSATAKRWRFVGGETEIGLITPVSEPFCGQCNRIRLTADGKLRTCLFSIKEHDIKPLLRQEDDDAVLARWLCDAVLKKEKSHNIGQDQFQQPERTMSAIGG